jgi:hypothetical protein
MRSQLVCEGYPPGASLTEAGQLVRSMSTFDTDDSRKPSGPSSIRSPSGDTELRVPWTHSFPPFYSPSMKSHESDLINGAISLISHHPVDEFSFVRTLLDDLIERRVFVTSSVRAAAAALGIAAKQVNPSRSSGAETQSQPAALYDKAVSCLRNRLSMKYHAEVELLFSCILLCCVELVLQRRQKALLHWHAAYQLSTILTDARPDLIGLDILFRMFDIHTLTHSDCTRLPKIDPLPLQPTLETTDADLLDRYVVETVHASECLIASTAFEMCQGQTAADLPQSQTEHIVAIQNCLKLITSLLHEGRPFVNRPHLLRTHNICLSTFIKVSCMLIETETAFDAYTPVFQQIVEQAQEILENRRQDINHSRQINQTSISMSIGIIEPLHLVATKCRHPALRRRALAYLRETGREGPWTGSVVATYAERCMHIEEGESTVSEAEQETSAMSISAYSSQGPADLVTIPEERRITSYRSHLTNGSIHGEDDPNNLSMRPSVVKVVFLRRRQATVSLIARTLTSGRIEDMIASYNFRHTTLDPNIWQQWTEIFE